MILASASPRRSEILRVAGFDFVVRVANVPEERRPGEDGIAFARRLAREKAEAVTAGAGDVVLGADTVVLAGAEVLEKPRDDADARRMLGLLSGREHEVVTAFCLRTQDMAMVDHAVTRVRFAPLSDAEIDAYVASGEPAGKAGGYAIQGLASKFVTRIDGDYFNVVGLPVAMIYAALKKIS